MKFIGDFHIHSPYSRATSKQLVPENLDLWGRLKGIKVIGTGDFTHPKWTEELEQRLVQKEEGLFILKDEYAVNAESLGYTGTFDTDKSRFMLTAEISSIYKYGTKVRKVHNVICAPSFDSVKKIQNRIESLGGNIRSDGRPILGLDSRDLLELCLEADERILFIPAHIWTPWFSALGSKSGFDTIEECFRDLSGYIHAVETGLSSDPPMNWMCSFLDKFTLVSNSDAHSPEKLGREANLFDTDLSYAGIIQAIKGGVKDGFRGTIEFFPQEGKYHFDGHRKCNTCWDPLETLEHGSICPGCGKAVTVGVLNRVAQLADRENISKCPRKAPFYSLIQLRELLSELEGVGPASKKVRTVYTQTLSSLGSELDILLNKNIHEIKTVNPLLGKTIERMRNRQVYLESGYDGEYGKIYVWKDGTKHVISPEDSLFGDLNDEKNRDNKVPDPVALIDFNLSEFQLKRNMLKEGKNEITELSSSGENKDRQIFTLNPDQKCATQWHDSPSLIIAGPGSGKTRTIVEKIKNIVWGGTTTKSILVLTFANKAAEELSTRLRSSEIRTEKNLSEQPGVRVFTFHSLGLEIIKKYIEHFNYTPPLLIADDAVKFGILKNNTEYSSKELKEYITHVSRIKNGLMSFSDGDEEIHHVQKQFDTILSKYIALDYDDLIFKPLNFLKENPGIAETLSRMFHEIIVDEYQDINPAQNELLFILARHTTLTAVGDPNQSIYGFRGSSPEFINNFSSSQDNTKIFNLTQSYRCPETVLQASAQVIGLEDNLIQGQKPGVSIDIFKAKTATSEAEHIARKIESLCGGVGFFSRDSDVAELDNETDMPLSEIALLCRTSLQMTTLEKALTDHHIPFKRIETTSFFSHEPYRSFLNFLIFLNHTLSHNNDGLQSRLSILTDKSTDTDISIPESYNDALTLFTQHFAAKSENCITNEELADTLKKYWIDGDSLSDFLEKVTLGSGIDCYEKGMEQVTLMTMHASKGLEFDAVFIPGCEDGIIPCSLTGETIDLEEEKRLLYVAMTRAKERLYLSYAKKRLIYGKSKSQIESPFLSAIEKSLTKRAEQKIKVEIAEENQLTLF